MQDVETRNILLTTSFPFPCFSDRCMNCNLQRSLQTASACDLFSKRGRFDGHLVPFLGSTRKLISFSPARNTFISETNITIHTCCKNLTSQSLTTITTWKLENCLLVSNFTFQVVNSLIHLNGLSYRRPLVTSKEIT